MDIPDIKILSELEDKFMEKFSDGIFHHLPNIQAQVFTVKHKVVEYGIGTEFYVMYKINGEEFTCKIHADGYEREAETFKKLRDDITKAISQQIHEQLVKDLPSFF